MRAFWNQPSRIMLCQQQLRDLGPHHVPAKYSILTAAGYCGFSEISHTVGQRLGWTEDPNLLSTSAGAASLCTIRQKTALLASYSFLSLHSFLQPPLITLP